MNTTSLDDDELSAAIFVMNGFTCSFNSKLLGEIWFEATLAIFVPNHWLVQHETPLFVPSCPTCAF